MKVIERDQLSGREYGRTIYALNWTNQPLQRNHNKTLQDYVDMKNLEHKKKRQKTRLAGKFPDKIMIFEIRP